MSSGRFFFPPAPLLSALLKQNSTPFVLPAARLTSIGAGRRRAVSGFLIAIACTAPRGRDQMKIGMIGLGKMGGNMTLRLLQKGHELVVYDRDAELANRIAASGAAAVTSLQEMISNLEAPRVVWVMVPAGDPTEATLLEVARLSAKGDIVIDGGNSRYTDTVRRAATLSEMGVRLIDAGTSGGIWGRELGYCLMVGGEQEAVKHCEPIFTALAPEDGYLHVGASGSGHFTKMIHNGIEYGMLQAYAEGFELLHASPFDLELSRIAKLWNRGSVVRSWLLELLESAYEAEGEALENVRGWVADSGEGRWTVETSIDLNVPAPVIALSLMARFRSRQDESYSAKVIAALRNEFGGHGLRRE
jgi:6-phosphogluconate dehydrogenase